jgi:hypothetical protein
MAINALGYYLGLTEAKRCHINLYTFYYQQFFSWQALSHKPKSLQVLLRSARPSNSSFGRPRGA